MIKLDKPFELLIICNLTLLKVFLVWSDIQSRIVGGTPTNITQVPYLVQVLYNNKFGCGGTLVSVSFVVTAAHCVNDKQPKLLTIVAGATYLNQMGARSSVFQIILPKGYIKHVDVAVLKLRYPIDGLGIEPIGLCTKGWMPGAAVIIYGWGKMNENDEFFPNQVRTLTAKVLRKYTCTYLYSQSGGLANAEFCASSDLKKGACYGDSGSPAIINGQFCGIVLGAGTFCAHRYYPGIYTNVLMVRKFITDAMRT